MRSIWAAGLEHRDLGVDDDFFELGGHSLRAVALLAAVADEFGVELGIADLLAAPTPRQLSELVRHDVIGAGGGNPGTWTGWTEGVVELAAGDPELGTIVLIPPNSGLQLLVDYRLLARHLDDGRRVVTFTPQGVTGREPPLDTVGALARHYRERVRVAVPRGRVVLGGHSLGGTVALETARLIEAEPDSPVEVEAVVLLDSRRFDDAAARRRVRLRRPFRRVRQAARARLDARRGRGPSPEAIIAEAGAAARRAALTYRLRSYDGRVVYLAARGTPGSPEPRRRDEGWGDLLPRLEVHDVPGRHSGDGSLVAEPHVAVTAAELRRALGRQGDGRQGARGARDQAKIGPTAG
jgi:thioesterase domain-containing protein/acyl carrier protein